MDGGREKKRLIRLSGLAPCLSNTARALEGLGAEDADERILKAALADARETLAGVFRALLSDLEADGTVRERPVQVLTCAGWVKAAYPYAPGTVTGRDAVRRLCGEEQAVRTKTAGGGSRGLPKATRGARRRAAEAVAALGSADEAQRFLSETGGMSAGRETERRIALEAGRRTQEAALEGRLEAEPRGGWTPPPGAVGVTPTLVMSVDGKGFGCTGKDLKGRRGRGGGAARTRTANVMCFRRYRHVDAKGRPIFEPRVARYHVTGAGGMTLGEEMYAVAVQEGLLTMPRAEFVTDGEPELECIYQDFFARNLPVKVVRVLDAMHACGYVNTLAKALEKDEGKAAKRSEQLRRRLVNAGWEGLLKSFHRVFGAEAELRLDGDGRKAWDYLWKRREQMDYRRLRRRHLVIGSGMVESACKLLIGTRLTGPGMHWRFANGVRIAMLRAAMRSRLKIAA